MMKATAVAHPNIALVKYWGKVTSGVHIPAVPSLSVTLSGLQTTTSVEWCSDLSSHVLSLNGDLVERGDAWLRVEAFLDEFASAFGLAGCARVTSRNDFPTASGLASSASGFAALALAASRAARVELTEQELVQWAQRGSVSAARSVLGGFVELVPEGTTESYCKVVCEPAAWPLAVVVAVIELQPKQVSSRAGMLQSQQTSPYFHVWQETSWDDHAAARCAVEQKDFAALAQVTRRSCMKMHAVMQTTEPPLLYWQPASVAVLQQVQRWQDAGHQVCCTMDAGPQVKLLCPVEEADFFEREVAQIPGVHMAIRCGVGGGVAEVQEQ